MDYIITLSDTEVKALEWAAASNKDWIQNAASNRARIAMNDIVALNTAHCNANSIAIAVGLEGQVDQAYSLGVIKTAAIRTAENLAAQTKDGN
jgi:hypothetical protein